MKSSVSDAFAEFVRSDLTYEVAAADDAGVVKWKWRKWAKGMFPGGTFSELNVFSTAEVELEAHALVRHVPEHERVQPLASNDYEVGVRSGHTC